ncbi:MAG: Low molecular weight protein-tyrosine-phosphatase YfkJ [Bacteroidota bacterium]
MVCLGNICRSPLAEGILREKLIKNKLEVIVDSAGTSGLHAGEHPDYRMCATAKSFGINIDDLKSRKFISQDFNNFDLIYAMDSSNYSNILSLACTTKDKSKVHLILNELYPTKNMAVPDPYYGGEQGFIDVYNLLNEATDKIIEKIKANG